MKIKMFMYAVIVMAIGAVFFGAEQAEASSLKISPLVFKDQLEPGEVRKSHIDISNTSDQEVAVTAEVEAFKQVDQNGELAFYPKAEYREGVVLDYDSFTLGPRETLRLYFSIDASRLPVGGVHAAIFFKTEYAAASMQTGIQPIVRVGALLVINNSSEPADLQIQKLHSPLLQFGHAVQAGVELRNASPEESGVAAATNITASLWPFGGSKELESPLIFPGNTRMTQMEIPSNYLGLVRLEASIDGNKSQKWIVAATGYGRWIVAALVMTPAILLLAIKRSNIRPFKAS